MFFAQVPHQDYMLFRSMLFGIYVYVHICLNSACWQLSHNAIFDWNSQNYSLKIKMLLVTEYSWEFQNNALWDTH